MVRGRVMVMVRVEGRVKVGGRGQGRVRIRARVMCRVSNTVYLVLALQFQDEVS